MAKQIAKHVRQALKAAGVRPDAVRFTARGHYLVIINGIKVTMAGSPSDVRAHLNAVANLKRAASH